MLSDSTRLVLSEMRRAIRKYEDLRAPIYWFRKVDRPSGKPEYWVPLDLSADVCEIDGLCMRVASVVMPDEFLQDKVYDFSRCVWHLSDVLSQAFNAEGVASTEPGEYGKSNEKILLARDLITLKKHPGANPQGAIHPTLGEVEFSTGFSGLVEIHYNGACKRLMMYVEIPNPLHFSIPICDKRGDGEEIVGDAAEMVWQGFCEWLPLIDQSGIIRPGDPEGDWLLQRLKDVWPA